MTAPSLLLWPSRAHNAGTGHLARCHALAETWTAAGGSAVMQAGVLPWPWKERFGSLGVQVVDSRSTSGFDWAVIDGYEYTIADHRKARALAERVLVIDDHCSVGDYDADIVVDQNLGAARTEYPPHTPALAGPK